MLIRVNVKDIIDEQHDNDILILYTRISYTYDDPFEMDSVMRLRSNGIKNY